MNPLSLLTDEKITDVLVNSTHPIWIERGGELLQTEHQFESEQALREYTIQLVQEHDTRIDLAKPFAELNLSSDFGLVRVHALLGGECSFGTQLSIRRHPQEFYTLQDLQQQDFISSEQMRSLLQILQSRKNFVIVGATGSGKTTLLRAMLMELKRERLIVIEETAELRIHNSMELFTRISNQEGVGEIGLAELAKQALRMRPDRLILGEARGSEVSVLLQAMNTGHSGAGFTLHANGIAETIPRLLTLLAQQNIQPSLGRMMIGSAIDYVIEVARNPSRRISQITELVI